MRTTEETIVMLESADFRRCSDSQIEQILNLFEILQVPIKKEKNED